MNDAPSRGRPLADASQLSIGSHPQNLEDFGVRAPRRRDAEKMAEVFGTTWRHDDTWMSDGPCQAWATITSRLSAGL
jgi:hypothetical protein